MKIFAEKFAVRIAEGGNNGGGPGGAEAPPGPSVVGSIGSIIRSVRSIIVQPTSVDRSEDVAAEKTVSKDASDLSGDDDILGTLIIVPLVRVIRVPLGTGN